MSTWRLHGIDIGLPLNINWGGSGDISSSKVTGTKAQAILNHTEPIRFKVELYKSFNNETEAYQFRQQLEQLQLGIGFMPYLLETNAHTNELHNHLVLMESFGIDREGGKVGWVVYYINFVDLGHKSEFYGFTQYRAKNVQSGWASWNTWRHVDVSYPVGAMFHSDSPTGTLYGEWGGMDYRVNPSQNTISYQECLGTERVGIVAKQGNIQLFSPHAQIGAGFSVTNGYFKMEIDSNGEIWYYRWNGTQYQNFHKAPIRVAWRAYSYINGNVENPRTLYSENAIRRKIQLKRFTTEFVEIEMEYQFSDGTITALMIHMNRGKNSIQLKTRVINDYMDWFYTYHYVDKTLVDNYTINNSTSAITDSTNVEATLTASPLIYLHFTPSAGGGYVGYVNPDINVSGIVRTNVVNGWVEIATRHSYNSSPKIWSEPIMYFQGTTSPTSKRSQAGYIIEAGSQVVHRSRVF